MITRLNLEYQRSQIDFPFNSRLVHIDCKPCSFIESLVALSLKIFDSPKKVLGYTEKMQSVVLMKTF